LFKQKFKANLRRKDYKSGVFFCKRKALY